MNGSVIRYGIKIPPLVDSQGRAVAEQPDWLIEKTICQNYNDLVKKFPKLLPRSEHFKKFCDYVWGADNERFPFEWNDNACLILERYHQHKWLAVAGHKSSGKTEAMALIGIAEFLIDPKNTKVIVTSTTGKSASGKIWGSCENCWNAAVEFFEKWDEKFKQRGINTHIFAPGDLVRSEKIIRMKDGKFFDPKKGIELIAPEQGKDKEAAKNIQGYKSAKLILMADELATIPLGILKTACENFTGNADFKMVGGFNPDSYYDAGGVMSKPVDGWSSITENSEEWETCIEPYGIRGWCIRFDGERSPNVLAGKVLWKGIYSLEQLIEDKKNMGEKTKGYWQMIRGYWSPVGSLEAIYSEADVVSSGADAPVKTWLEPPTLIAGLDPSFTHGGDKAVLVIAKCGLIRDALTMKNHKVFERLETLVLDNDITDKSIDKNEWIVMLVKQKLHQYGITPLNLAVDTTGGGAAFASLLRRDIGAGFMDIVFNSSPTDERYSAADKRTGKERFTNLMAEIWFVGKELIRCGQIKNLDPDTVSEMCARTYEEDKSGKVIVEPKAKMKLRTKKSPDRSDAMFCALHLARIRHSLRSTERAATPQRPKPRQPLDDGWHAKPRIANLYDLVDSFGGSQGSGWGDSGW